jgi:hypothetical protein
MQALIILILLFRFTVIDLIFSINNNGFLYFLLPCILFDIVVLLIANRVTIIKQLNKTLTMLKYDNIKSIQDDKFLISIKDEIEKYGLNKLGNRFGKKKVLFFKSESNNIVDYAAYSIFNYISCIILPKDADLSKTKNKIMIAHEISHTISDDLVYTIKKLIYLYSVTYIILGIIMCQLSAISIIIIVSGTALVIIQKWDIIYTEIIANNTAIEILEHADPPIVLKESVDVLLRIKKNNLRYYLVNRKGNLGIAELKAQINHLETVKNDNHTTFAISPINVPIQIFTILLLILPVAFQNKSLIQSYSISLQALIPFIFLVIVFYILYFCLLVIEGRKQWKLTICLGQK